MLRTNIYLEECQLAHLRALAQSRGEPVAALVRLALDEWLAENGARVIGRDEWERRFDELLARRSASARDRGLDEAAVEREVMAAVQEVRGAAAARRP